MKLNLYILGESKKLGLNNTSATLEEIHSKLHEEAEEVEYEFEKLRYYRDTNSEKYYEARMKFGQEVLDLIQISIAALMLLIREGLDIRILLFKHNRKLITERRWKPLKTIQLEIKKYRGEGLWLIIRLK